LEANSVIELRENPYFQARARASVYIVKPQRLAQDEHGIKAMPFGSQSRSPSDGIMADSGYPVFKIISDVWSPA
jgi:hypothetical protein